MLNELSADEWAEWMAFYALEPWGFDVLDAFNAVLASTAARAFGAEVDMKDFLIGPRLPSRDDVVETTVEVEEVDIQDKVKLLFGHRDVKAKSPRRGA